MSIGVLDLRVAAPQREHDASRIEKTYAVLAGRFGFHKAKAKRVARAMSATQRVMRVTLAKRN